MQSEATGDTIDAATCSSSSEAQQISATLVKIITECGRGNVGSFGSADLLRSSAILLQESVKRIPSTLDNINFLVRSNAVLLLTLDLFIKHQSHRVDDTLNTEAHFAQLASLLQCLATEIQIDTDLYNSTLSLLADRSSINDTDSEREHYLQEVLLACMQIEEEIHPDTNKPNGVATWRLANGTICDVVSDITGAFLFDNRGGRSKLAFTPLVLWIYRSPVGCIVYC